MSPAGDAEAPRPVCLRASDALAAMLRQVGPQAMGDRGLSRERLDRLQGSDRLGDVVKSLVGGDIEPDHVAHLNAQPERFQRDVLTVVRAAVAEGRGLDLDLRLTADGRAGTEVSTWYEDDGLHRSLVILIPPPP